MSIDISQFLHTFFEESFEGLDAMENNLLHMDVNSCDVEEINTIFRVAHSVKGGAATFGLKAVAEFTHSMETLLDQIRGGEKTLSDEGVDVLLRSVDVLRSMLANSKAGNELDFIESEEIKKRLDELLDKGSSKKTVMKPVVERKDDQQITNWEIKFIPETGLFKSGNDPVRMFRGLSELGIMEATVNAESLPDFESLNPEECHLSWDITISGKISKEQIAEIFEWVADDCKLTITSVEEEATAQLVENMVPEDVKIVVPIVKPMPGKEGRATQTESASIRVSIDKVDDLINMVGELVITQSMLGQLGQDFEMSKIEKLSDGLAQLERNTRELQESVMRIRMLPISFVFQRFPRIVRDLSTKLGKKVELIMNGESTELDKTVMEKIGDPLVHLVRNSLDHGIEMPEMRRKSGKDEIGLITLNAFHQGGNIVIEIIDDGKGLDKAKILEKARARGLVGSDEDFGDDKVADLIFAPGLSTAEVVSDVSGRGVGMDVVRKNIKSLGGNVEVRTEAGKGSRFTIRLPLTLAILDGQLVRVGEETYIVPLVSIIETLQIKKKYINDIAGKAQMYRLREDYIPIIRLYQSFGLKPDQEHLENGLLVVVEGDGQKAGLFVDDLLSQQQVVIKSLETNFQKVQGLSGATILGDGTVALILDISGLLASAKDSAQMQASGAAA